VLGSTAPDYQYSATCDAIVGTPFASNAEFLEVTRAGQRTLVGKTRTMQQAKSLADHVRERIKGARPAIVCEPMPEVLRSIQMR
jgi:hypothetical protein